MGFGVFIRGKAVHQHELERHIVLLAGRTVGVVLWCVQTSNSVAPSSRDQRAWQLMEDEPDRTLVVDSGAAKHCIPMAALSQEEISSMVPLDSPVSLQTANGVIIATHKVRIWSKDLEAFFEFLVLPNLPLCPDRKPEEIMGYPLNHEGS